MSRQFTHSPLPSLLVGATLFAMACSRNEGEHSLPPASGPGAAPPPVLPEAPASAREVAATAKEGPLLLTGKTHPIEEAALSAKVPGTLARVHVHEGDAVKKGQVVFRIEGSNQYLAMKQAKVGLEAAKVSEREAELAFERTKQLHDKGAVSRAQFDTAKLAFDRAKIGVQQAKVSVSQAAQSSSDVTQRSPIDGLVAKKEANTGEMANPGKPVVIIHDITTLEIRVDVPQTAIGRIHVGDPMEVRFREMGRKASIKVERISPTVDSETRAVRVIGHLDNPDGVYKTGMILDVEFPKAGGKATPPPAPSASASSAHARKGAAQ